MLYNYLFMLRKILWIFFLLSVVFAQAQPQSATWELQDGEKGDDIFFRGIQLSNGLLALVGNQGSAVDASRPSGLLALVDFSSGQHAGQFAIGGKNGAFLLSDLAEHPDGNILLAGSAIEKNAAWLAKVTLQGEILWQKTPADLGITTFTQLLPESENSFLLSGTAKDGSYAILKCDSVGVVRWKRKWTASESGPLKKMALGPNGTIGICGNTAKAAGQTVGDVWVALLDKDGKDMWRKTFGEKLWEEVSDLAILADGAVLFCGETNSSGMGKQDMWLVRLNPFGFKQWEKTYGGREEDRATALLPLHNGDLVLAGQSLSLLEKKGATKFAARIVETDPGGNLLWEGDYGGDGHEGINSLFQIHDGSFLLAGWTESASKGGKDAWLLHFPTPPHNRLLAKGTLNVENSKVWLSTRDGFLRPDMQSYLSFELTNQESARLDNIRIEVRALQGQPALKVDQDIYEQPLFPGLARQVFVPVSAASGLETKDNLLQINVFSGSDKIKSFDATLKSLNPKGSSLRIVQTQHSREGLDALSPQVLTVVVQNDGDLTASDVQVDFTVPKGILLLNGESVAIGQIPSKATGKAIFRFQKTVQFEGNEVKIICQVRDKEGHTAREEVSTRLDVLQAGQRADFVLFTQPNEAKVKRLEWNQPTFALEATFGTSSKTLKPGDALIKINGVTPEQSKMDEEELSPPTTQGGLNYYAYSNTIALREGENRITLEVKTPFGVIQSNEVIINYRPKQPNLHILSIGIPHRDLKYTTQDAERFAAAFANQAGEDKVFGKVFIDKRNTRENTRNLDIRAAMEDLKRRYSSDVIQGKIAREDVLILFISSHGKTDDNNNFKILASDYDTYGDVSNIDYKRDILDVLNTIDCKKFVFIDACHSGSAEGARLLNQARFALEEINAAYPGMNVMTSSQVDELSYEDDAWQDGAFTKAILEAFQGQDVLQSGATLRADADGDKIIRFGELYDFMKKRVPALVMEKKKSKQMPVKMSKGLGDTIPIFVLY